VGTDINKINKLNLLQPGRTRSVRAAFPRRAWERDQKEEFLLDIWKGKIALKSKYQTRGRKVFVLIRLDLNGAPHRNPDGEEVAGTHIHLYREGYGDKWAYPVNSAKFPNLDDLWKTLHDFMDFCNIQKKPVIERGLF